MKKNKKEINEEKFYKNVCLIKKQISKAERKIKKQNIKRRRKLRKYIEKRDDNEILHKIKEFNENGKQTICYFVDSFYPCIDGVLYVLESYVEYMQKYYNVVVCAPKHNGECYKIDKYFVLYANSVPMKKQGYDMAWPSFDSDFQKYISLLNIHLIHLQSPFNMGAFGLELAKKRKIPCFSTFHSQFKKNFYDATKSELLATWLTRTIIKIYQNSTVALTMNPFAKNVMIEYGLKRPVEIVPNATNLVKKKFKKEFEVETLNKYHINTKTFNMIFIGRFVAVKNIFFILEVLKDLVKVNPNFNYIFLGYGPDEEKLKQMTREYGLQNHVIFTGKITDDDEKAVIIKNSNLMFFPSKYEIDSLVKIEAACYDVPTLCLENTSISSVLIDNQNGFICKDDKKEIVNRLDFLIKNVDFVKEVGKKANLEVYLTWDDSCKILKKLYDENINKFILNKKRKITKKHKKIEKKAKK
ncbi:MAG: glycosyltransferase [Clostridia bacterium]|nr:glycosyltransferase [Clostridia bacterium]